MQSPPDRVIAEAVEQARMSPCAKSKRGAVLFYAIGSERIDRGRSAPIGRTVGHGFNHPPEGFVCDGSMSCRSDCAKICIHAEDAAIRNVHPDYVYGIELVHVKVVDGELVPGGPPSCWQCSRVIAETEYPVWLFEAQRWHDELMCKQCRRITIIAQGAGTTGVCEQCDFAGRLLDIGKRVYDVTSGVWQRYDAKAFHAETLRNCGLHIRVRA
jgi:hypothetical protein